MHVKSLQVEQPLEKNWGPGKEEEDPCEKLNVCACKLKSCLTLCHPTDCSPPGSSVLGILQARILERVAIPFPRILRIELQKKVGIPVAEKALFSLYAHM